MIINRKLFLQAREKFLQSFADELNRCRRIKKIPLKKVAADSVHIKADYIDRIELNTQKTYPSLNTLIYIALACDQKISVKLEDF